MKKLLSLVLIIMLFLLAISCSSQKAESTSYEASQKGITSKITYTHDGDKVLTQTAINTINYEESGLKDKDTAKQQLDPMVKKYEEIKSDAISYSIDYQDKQVVQTIKIDFAKIKPEEFKNLPGTLSSGDVSKGISLKESEKLLLNSGYKKVEK